MIGALFLIAILICLWTIMLFAQLRLIHRQEKTKNHSTTQQFDRLLKRLELCHLASKNSRNFLHKSMNARQSGTIVGLFCIQQSKDGLLWLSRGIAVLFYREVV